MTKADIINSIIDSVLRDEDDRVYLIQLAMDETITPEKLIEVYAKTLAEQAAAKVEEALKFLSDDFEEEDEDEDIELDYDEDFLLEDLPFDWLD